MATPDEEVPGAAFDDGPGDGPDDVAGDGAPAWRTRLLSGRSLRALRLVFSAAVVGALAWVCYRAVSDISSLSFHVRPGWLVLAWPLAILSFPLLAVSWAQMLSAYGHRVPVPTIVRLWCLAQASRYLPTGLAAIASRAVLAARHGVPRALSVTTMAAEGGLLLAWCALGSGALLFAGGHEADWPVTVVGGIGILAAPPVLVAAGRLRAGNPPANRMLRLLLRFARSAEAPRAGPLVAADATIGANLAVKTVVFVLYASALLPVHPADIALLVGATNLAVVAGLIGVTPAGIGVREGVLVALLQHRFGAANATAMALSLRVWDLTVELPWVLGSVVANRRRGAQEDVAAA